MELKNYSQSGAAGPISRTRVGIAHAVVVKVKYTPLSGFTQLSNTSKADANFYRIIVSTVSNLSGRADEDRPEVQSICIAQTMILQILYPL